MNVPLELKLYKKYPWLKGTPYGLCVGNGWFTLLDELCDYIDNAIKFENKCIEDYKKDKRKGNVKGWSWTPNNKPYKYPIMEQVKNKFGGLRFYCILDNTRYDLRGAISFAEQFSFTICEECGHPGKLRKRAFIQTLCDKCNKEMEETPKN